MKKFRWIFWGLLVATMCCIFVFSSQNAKNSTKTSNVVTNKIVNVSGIETTKNNKEKIYAVAEHMVRKSAHFFLYFTLSIFAFLAIYSTFNFKKKLFYFLYPFLICVIYATSDEIHQLFVKGRTCKFLDVCIDSAGGILGITLIFIIISVIYNKKYNKKFLFD